jgi:hypothetical protein
VFIEMFSCESFDSQFLGSSGDAEGHLAQ